MELFMVVHRVNTAVIGGRQEDLMARIGDRKRAHRRTTVRYVWWSPLLLYKCIITLYSLYYSTYVVWYYVCIINSFYVFLFTVWLWWYHGTWWYHWYHWSLNDTHTKKEHKKTPPPPPFKEFCGTPHSSSSGRPKRQKSRDAQILHRSLCVLLIHFYPSFLSYIFITLFVS